MSGKQNTISVCMIVRDEEKFLPACIESVKGFADEIIVVDTGSTDKTVEIAESYGAKVYHYEWNDSFSDARNRSIDLATGEWIFILDADERLDEQSKPVIRQAIDEGKYEIFSIFQSSQCREHECEKLDIYKGETIRIWRNSPKIRYKGRVHEAVCNGNDTEVRGATINAIIHHDGYLPEIIDERNKELRNTMLMQIELDKDPNSLHYLFHMAKQCHATGNLEQALAHFESAANLLTPKHRTLSISIYSYMASINCTLGRCEKALELLDQVEACGLKHPEIVYNRGRALLIMHKYEQALDCFSETLKLRSSVNWGDLSVCEYKADWGISAALLGLQRFDESIEKAKFVINKNPGYLPANLVLIHAYQSTGQFDALGNHLLWMNSTDEKYLDAARRLIAVYESQGRVSDIKKMCDHLVECGCDAADIQLKLGVCAEADNNAPTAELHYKHAIELDDQCVEAYNNLGLLYAENGCISDGLEVLSLAIEKFSGYSNTYFNTGDVLYKIGEYSTAADMYQAGLLRCPDHAPGYFTLGNCYYQMSAYEAAALAYKQALVLCPDYHEAANNLELVEKVAA